MNNNFRKLFVKGLAAFFVFGFTIPNLSAMKSLHGLKTVSDVIGNYGVKKVYPSGNFDLEDIINTHKLAKCFTVSEFGDRFFRLTFDFFDGSQTIFDVRFGYLTERDSFDYGREVKIYNSIVSYLNRINICNKRLKTIDYDAETEFVVPNNVTKIGDGSFICCGSFKKVIIPQSVTHIGRYAFASCKNLKDVLVLRNSENESINIDVESFFDCNCIVNICFDDKK